MTLETKRTNVLFRKMTSLKLVDYYVLVNQHICLPRVSEKTVPVLLFELLRETLADFNNFWHATSWRNLTQMTAVLPTLP